MNKGIIFENRNIIVLRGYSSNEVLFIQIGQMVQELGPFKYWETEKLTSVSNFRHVLQTYTPYSHPYPLNPKHGNFAKSLGYV